MFMMAGLNGGCFDSSIGADGLIGFGGLGALAVGAVALSKGYAAGGNLLSGD
jgi:hypothetical protein